MILSRAAQTVSEQFEAAPMGSTYKQRQPHIGNGSFRMDERLQTKCEYDRCPPSNALSANPQSPEGNRYCEQRSRNRRGETRGEIVFAKNAVARDQRQIGEGRLVE